MLIGHHVTYSASPGMQEAAFRAVGLDWSYSLADVPPKGLQRAVATLREEDVAGANVTTPYKVAVIELIDGLEGEAAGAGAVNTVRRVGGRLIGSNTDVIAIRAALSSLGIADTAGTDAVILGGGGSARAAALALMGANLTVVARRPGIVELPGRTLGDVRIMPWSGAGWTSAVRQAQVVVNATPLGREGELPLAPEDLPPNGVVVDLVYVQGGTPLVRAARLRGIRCADGWDILLAQGAASFQTWTGRQAPLEAMRAALPS